jgi:hypothetical protein
VPVATVIGTGDADGRPEVTLLATFLWVTGDIHLAGGGAVTGEAGRAVIFGDENAERRTAVSGGVLAEGLALGPFGPRELLSQDGGLPIVGACPTIADENLRRGHLYARLLAGLLAELLADEAREHGRDEPFEADAGAVDGRLVLGDDVPDGRHLGTQKPSLPRVRVRRLRIPARLLAEDLHGLRENPLGRQLLVLSRRVVDEVLVLGDDRARGAQHLGELRGDGHVVVGRRCSKGSDASEQRGAGCKGNEEGGPMDGRFRLES